MIVYKAMAKSTSLDDAIKFMRARVEALTAEGWTKHTDIVVTEGPTKLGGREHVARCQFTKGES